MMPDQIDWVVITGATNKKIGAIGFIGDKAAIVTAFYDDRDANQDGTVSWGESVVSFMSPIKLKGYAITEVAMAARYEIAVIERDASFSQEAGRMFVGFASHMIVDGLYAVYFSRAIGSLGTGVAGAVTDNVVKQFVIRKGFEAAVKGVYNSAMKGGSAYTETGRP